MKRVLIATEKHGKRCFDASTQEALHAAALKILRERDAAGYWYLEPEKPPPEPTDEQIAALPEGPVRTFAEQHRGDYKSELHAYERDKRVWTALRKAIDANDGELAWKVLRRRSDDGYEYEDVELIELETAP